MPIQILMPALSPTMTEGTLARWLKAEGDSIAPGDILAEIETDKATMEIEAIDEGTLAKILIPGGTENVPINTLIAVLLEEGEEASALEALSAPSSTQDSSPSPASTSVKEEPVPSSSVEVLSSGQRLIASPLAKRLALQHQIDLTEITGSGPRGRIVKADVEDHLGSSSASQRLTPQLQSKDQLSTISSQASPYEDVKLSTMRKVIARRLTESKTTVPHFYLSIDCHIDALLRCRQDINASVSEAQKVSVNDFVLKAVAKALKDVPEANVSYLEGSVRRYRHADISVAVAIDGGLVTPVVRQAETLGLLDLSTTVKALVARARAGSLTPEEYQGGTFSVSNLGMYGVQSFSAILNPPQACILAVGAGQMRPIVVADQVVPGTVMSCTLSVDHRVIDGAVGALFFQAFKKYIENPLLLLV